MFPYVTCVCRKNKQCHMTSYDTARLHLIAPMIIWQTSNPIFDAAAFCKTKFGNVRKLLQKHRQAKRGQTTASTYSAPETGLRSTGCLVVEKLRPPPPLTSAQPPHIFCYLPELAHHVCLYMLYTLNPFLQGC